MIIPLKVSANMGIATDENFLFIILIIKLLYRLLKNIENSFLQSKLLETTIHFGLANIFTIYLSPLASLSFFGSVDFFISLQHPE